MRTSKLKLTSDKTEFLLIENKRQRSKFLPMFPIEPLSVKTNAAKSARNIAVIFYNNFTFPSTISAVCSSWFYHIQDMWRIRHHLDLDSEKLLAIALVSGHLDYCKSHLYGIVDTDLGKLQSIQNWLAPVEIKPPPFTCCVPVLRSLHWLPAKFRILFNIILLT